MRRSSSDTNLSGLTKQQLKAVVRFRKVLRDGKAVACTVQDLQFINEAVNSDEVGENAILCVLMAYTMTRAEFKKRIENMVLFFTFLEMLKMH